MGQQRAVSEVLRSLPQAPLCGGLPSSAVAVAWPRMSSRNGPLKATPAALGGPRPPSAPPPGWRAERQGDEDVSEDQVDSVEPPTDTQWSEGSEGHPDKCNPCLWYWKGCNAGLDCTYCHMCPPGEKKRRAKAFCPPGEKKRRAKARKAEAKVQGVGDTEEVELAAENYPTEADCLELAEREPEADCLEPPTETQWSEGSEGHPDICNPCPWFWRGCRNGADCKHCHMCPEGEKKKRAKEKKAEFKAQKRLGADVVVEPTVQEQASIESDELAEQKSAAEIEGAELQSNEEASVEPPAEPMWSAGSEGHPDTCRPCAWFWKGCRHGVECSYCHMCPEGETKKRAKTRKAELKVQTRAAALAEGTAALAAPLRSAKPSMAPHVAAKQAAVAAWMPYPAWPPQDHGSWPQWGHCLPPPPPPPMQQRWSDGQPATKRWREW